MNLIVQNIFCNYKNHITFADVMDEELKNIRILLDYYDEECKHSTEMMTIKVNKPKNMDKSRSLRWGSKLVYEMTFSLVLPEHIHKYLLGKTIPSDNRTMVYDEKFAKTINNTSIQGLTERYWDILQDYRWLKGIDKAELQKVIFYSFDTESRTYKSDWNGWEFGKKNKLSYVYAIGYISHANGKEVRYNFNKQLIHDGYNREFYNNEYVGWTEEREGFFNNIQTSFETIIDRINEFEKNLNEDTINQIIENRTLLLS